YPSHTYNSAGFYNICLSIVDSAGCSDSTCVEYELQKSGEMNTIISVEVVDSIPGIATESSGQTVLQSYSAFPNPTSESILISYTLSTSALVKIELYDL